MNNIKFNDGMKSFSVNGDENKKIYFNPSDYNILERFKTAFAQIENLETKYNETKKNNNRVMETSIALDKEIKEAINYIFGSDVSTIAFGTTNCLSTAGGEPICVNFLNAVLPILKKEIKAEKEKSEKKIAKYTKQVKK